jgi:tetratricopeptide (TPR) repeat protein
MNSASPTSAVTATRLDVWRKAVALHGENRLHEAEQLYRALLKDDPDHPSLLNKLGVALLQQGRDAEALPFLEAASAALPGDVNVWNQRALALSHLERFEEAHQVYLKALALEPHNADLLANMGANLFKAERFRESQYWLQQAVDKAPEAVGARVNLANVLIALQQDSAARRLLEAVIGEGHRSLEAMLSYGTVLRNARETQAALAVLRDILKRKPDHADAMVAIGNILLDEGKFGEAQGLFERAHAIRPQMSDALAGIMRTRKMTPQDRPWMEAAEAVMQRNLPAQQAIRLRYAMGKFCDDVEDFDRAFAHYKCANEIQKRIYGDYDWDKQKALFHRLISVYSREVVSRRRAGASLSTLPVFIVGMQRSGTSLTEQIIASHPDAFGAGELFFWGEQAKRCDHAALRAADDPPWLSTLSAAALDDLRRRAPQASRITDKMPGNFKYLGLIHAAFPKARILHIRRHPIDTCLSIYFQNFNDRHAYATDLEHLARYYREYYRLMAHWRAALSPEVLLDVPYEALVDDPERWSRKIIEFIGLEWDARCLDFHLTERRVGTPSKWQVRQKIYKTSKERWRNYEKFVGPLLPLLELSAPSST